MTSELDTSWRLELGRHLNRDRAIAVLVLAVAAFVAVASVVDAIRHDSWAPLVQIGWLPAVLVAALAPAKDCRGRFRAR
jgi:hypothetical protein